MGIFIGDRDFVFSPPAVHGLDCNELPSGISYVTNATNAPNDSNDYFLVQTILSSWGEDAFQLACSVTENELYMRSKVNNTYKAWRKLSWT